MKELNSRRLEIDALRALSAIRQHGGITRAAVALGLSQSAVSHKIKRLEISLDCELLGRKSGGSDVHRCGRRPARLRQAYSLVCMTRLCSAFRRPRSREGLPSA